MPNIDCPHCGAKPMATGNASTVFVYWQCGTPIRGQQGKTCRILQLEGEVERLQKDVDCGGGPSGCLNTRRMCRSCLIQAAKAAGGGK